MNAVTITEIESLLGYVFADKGILVTAFTHASFAKENAVENNRRLEFLGDAVLGFLVARSLFYDPALKNEGELTKRRQSLVSREPLAKTVRRMGLLRFLRVGRNENPTCWSDKAVSDLYEAVLGAIYFDSGDLRPAELFFHRTVFSLTGRPLNDPISALKEYAEKDRETEIRTVEYAAENSFECKLFVGGQVFEGAGRTKKEAEREACRKACAALGLI